MKTLYIVDNKQQLREWSIEEYDDGFMIRHGVVGGSLQEKFEQVLEGKVNRDVYEQIELQMNSRINKQIDRGYVESIEEAKRHRATNAIGQKKPMLAQKYSDVLVSFNQPVYVQRKYDGNRCIIHNKNGEIIAYSRNGKPISSISHIIDNMHIPVGMSVDGELYAHGYKLQEIVSWIKRKQEDTLKLKYHAYDIMLQKPFDERFNILSKNVFSDNDTFEIVDTYAVGTKDALVDYHSRFRSEGFEGTIIRTNNSGYEDGKRSKSLIKMKDWNDAEFLVIDVIPSKDQWARLICAMPDGNTFRVTAPGTMYEKEEVLLNKENYIGKCVTVEYAYLTEDGIPFHPIAKCWR